LRPIAINKSHKTDNNEVFNMQIAKETIKEIAEQLECGMKCYLKKETGKIIVIISDEELNDSIKVHSHDEIKEINENPGDYIEFEKISSRESFEFMMDFAEEICEEPFKTALITALNSKNPFRNFKSKIDNSGSCRQKWFAYSQNKYFEYVKMQIPDNMLE